MADAPKTIEESLKEASDLEKFLKKLDEEDKQIPTTAENFAVRQVGQTNISDQTPATTQDPTPIMGMKMASLTGPIKKQ